MGAPCRGKVLKAVTVAFILMGRNVVAFVNHALFRERRDPYILQASPGDLKTLLETASYDNDVVKAYAGATIKTPARTVVKKAITNSYDLSTISSVDDTVTTSMPSTPTVPETPMTMVDSVSSPSSPTGSKAIESITQNAKEPFDTTSFDSVTSSPSSTVGDPNPLESLSVPSDAQKAMDTISSFFDSMQDSIQAAQQNIAAQQSAAHSTGTSSGVGGSSFGMIPTKADDMLKSLNDLKVSMGAVTEKIETMGRKFPELTIPRADVKLPDMPSISLPSIEKIFKLPQIQSINMGATDFTFPEPGKALTFGEYIRAKAAGVLPNDESSFLSTQTDMKAKFALMVANGYKLIGEEVPESFDDIQFPSLQDVSTLLYKVSIDFKKFVETSPESIPWIAVALGTLLVVTTARTDTPSPSSLKETPATSPQVMAAADLDGLAEDLESLQSRMKDLEETGLILQAELKAAKEKLLEKEREIRLERRKVVNNQLTLNREVAKMERKLKASHIRVKSLDKELETIRNESEALKKKLNATPVSANIDIKAEVIEKLSLATEKDVSEEGPRTFDKVQQTDLRSETKDNEARVIEEISLAFKENERGVGTLSVQEVEMEELPLATKDNERAPSPHQQQKNQAAFKASIGKHSTTQAAPAKSKAKGTSKPVEFQPPLFFADKVHSPAPAPEQAAIKKSVNVAPVDFSLLSKSSLAKKTIKELSEYLDSKGIPTTGPDGKTLKKAELVEAALQEKSE